MGPGMRVAVWAAAGLVGVTVVWCGLLWPLATIAVVVTVVAMGAGYLYFVRFRPPPVATTFDRMTVGKWRAVDLGGTTVSGDGSPYAIYVRRGSSANLIIHFSGGGACWDDHTAARPITPIRVLRGYTRDLKAFYFTALTRLFPAGLTGLADRRDRENGFRDWNIVFIPYTTGDLHVGDIVRTYTGKRTTFDVHHNGRNNATAALGWVLSSFRDVGKIMVSGESSGAWASAFYAPLVADHYPGKRIYCLSDGVGVRSARWPEVLDRIWNADSTAHLGFAVGVDLYEDALLHRTDGRARDIKYLHGNTLFDDTLTRFSAALNGRSTATDDFIDDWAAETRSSMSRLADAKLPYQYFLTDWGHNTRRHTTAHTMTTNESYRTCRADGVTYAEWLRRNVIDDDDLSVGAHLLT